MTDPANNATIALYRSKQPGRVKNITAVFLLLAFASLTGCESCEKEDRTPGDFSYLNGKWIGSGYQCNGLEPDEEVTITWTPVSGIVAVKLTGDACVNAGSVTFRGNYDFQAEQFNITWTTGNASCAGCYTAPGTLKIIDDDTLEGSSGSGGVVTFRR